MSKALSLLVLAFLASGVPCLASQRLKHDFPTIDQLGKIWEKEYQVAQADVAPPGTTALPTEEGSTAGDARAMNGFKVRLVSVHSRGGIKTIPSGFTVQISAHTTESEALTESSHLQKENLQDVWVMTAIVLGRTYFTAYAADIIEQPQRLAGPKARL